ncbi:MAG: hypothetical protein JST75_04945 [Bacteroidetes bacterium]|nr:hypothetical protein [Bacteroidota bacterium]
MANTSLNSAKSNFAFLIRMDMPLDTMRLVIIFLCTRKIILQSMQMYSTEDGEAVLNLYCLMARDKAIYIRRQMEKLNGVIVVELFENKGTRMH